MTVGLMMVVRNERARIRECLDHHLPYVDQVSICDQHSDDGTFDILREYEAASKIPFFLSHDNEWGYCEPSKQPTAERLTTDWILYVDADEKFDVEFLKNMHKIIETKVDGFSFPRITTFTVQVYDETVPLEPKILEVKHPAKDYQLRLTRAAVSFFPKFLHNRVRIFRPDGTRHDKKLGYVIEHRKTIAEQRSDQERYKYAR